MALWRRRAGAAAAAGPAPVPVDLLRRAQAGDGHAREQLIRKYRPFALAVASRVLGRFVHPDEDATSVSLIAFNEAIDGYDQTRGGSFLSFAETVIRRRLIDHLRVVKRRGDEVPLTGFEQVGEDGNVHNPVADREAAALHAAQVEALERRHEIARLRQRLMEFGIRFAELPQVAPQHADARERAIAVARLIASEPRYMEHLRKTRTLPLRELEGDARVGLSRKTLERQRKFIIAVALILGEPFESLREFIPDA